MSKQRKQKLEILIISIILTAIVVLLYFLDTSLEWNTLKTGSCIIISIWVFFIPPTVLYFIYKCKNSDMNYNIRLGVSMGINGIWMFLLAPIYGILAYVSNLDEIKG